MGNFNETDKEFTNCPHCEAQILKKARLCKHCKKSVEMIECPFCAEEILKTSNSCKHCGRELKYNIYSSVAVGKLKRKVFKFLFYVFFIFLLILVFFFGFVYSYPALKEYWEINQKISAFSKLCDAKDLSACLELADIYADPYKMGYMQKDIEKAFSLYIDACENGAARGCFEVGLSYKTGLNVNKNYKEALEYFGKSCEKKYGRGCLEIGYFYVNGWVSDIGSFNYNDAKNYFVKACSFGSMDGCISLGQNECSSTVGVKTAAYSFHKKACDAGDYLGCVYLGLTYFYGFSSGEGVDYDEVLKKMGVSEGVSLSPCYEFPEIVYNKKAIAAFEKACLGGNMHGCENLGTMYENGRGVQEDFRRAFDLYKKACEGGVESACERYKKN